MAYSALIVAATVVLYWLGFSAVVFLAAVVGITGIALGEHYRSRPNITANRVAYIMLFACWVGLAVFFLLSVLFIKSGMMQPSVLGVMIFAFTGLVVGGAATTMATFGRGVGAKLVEKALTGLAEPCKGVGLPQERTAELARLVEDECRRRAPYLRQAPLEEARGAVILVLIEMATERDIPRQSYYLQMVRQASILFVDLTKSTKRMKPSELDEVDKVDS